MQSLILLAIAVLLVSAQRDDKKPKSFCHKFYPQKGVFRSIAPYWQPTKDDYNGCATYQAFGVPETKKCLAG